MVRDRGMIFDEISDALPEVSRLLSGASPLTGGDWELTVAHLRVLRAVPESGTCSIGELSRRLGTGREPLAQLVSDLVDRGLLERSIALTDGRSMLLRLPPAGRDMRLLLRRQRRLRTELALRDLPAHQLEQVAESVALLRSALQQSEALA